MLGIFPKAAFSLLLLSGAAFALGGCSGNEAPAATTAQYGATENPCSHVMKVAPNANGLGGHQMPPACDEYLENHPNVPSLESSRPGS